MELTNKPYTVYLVGNPNAGKTTLFNKLTGLSQKTANYPGITVEKKSALIKIRDTAFELVDLPGTYSLYPNSLDEKVVLSELLNNPPDLILVIGDSTNLQRSLLLYTQVADLGYPIQLVLNMSDELKRKGWEIEKGFLEKEIGTGIFFSNAKKGTGVEEIKNFLAQKTFKKAAHYFAKDKFFEPLKSGESLSYRTWHEFNFNASKNVLTENIKRLETIDRYNQIEKICQLTLRQSKRAIVRKKRTELLDKWLMHPIGGYFFIAIILYIVFQFLFTVASIPMDGIDFCFSVLSEKILSINDQSLMIRILAEGIIPGIAGIAMFIPQIALLYLFITILEESGYMARVVFLMDKVMCRWGLSGKSIIPLISGTACAIPAIASTRTINNFKERIITILTVPFMTCSARLPVYAILIAVVIPLPYQGLTLLGLYLLGALGAVLTAILLNRVVETKERSMLIMELPPYRIPTAYNILISIKNAVTAFFNSAGKIIFSISIILWILASFGTKNFNTTDYHQKIALEDSYIGKMGKTVEPLIQPLGYDWKIGIALISSFAAREVFVGTLATIYSIDPSKTEDETTIKEKLIAQRDEVSGKPIYNLASGLSLLIFYVFSLQCMSTIAAIKKETNSWKWAIGSFAYMGVLAYGLAFIVYQLLK